MGAGQSSLPLACCRHDGGHLQEVVNVEIKDVLKAPKAKAKKQASVSVEAVDEVDDESLPSPGKSMISTVDPRSDGVTVRSNEVSTVATDKPEVRGPSCRSIDSNSEDKVALPYHPLSAFHGMHGYAGYLTEAEEECLQQLRLAVSTGECSDAYAHCVASSHEHEDHMLLRFLRARQFHVEKALKMLETDVEWRQESGMSDLVQQSAEEVLGCDPKKLDTYVPVKHIGFDRQGRPVIAKHLGGKSHIGAMLDTTGVSMEQVLRYHVWTTESFCDTMAKQSEKLGVNVEQLVVILDTKGFRLWQLGGRAFDFITRMAAIDSNHYPERLGLLVVVNASPVVAMAWRAIRKFLDERTQAKIFFTSSIPEAKAVLLQHIEADQVPEEYGGTAPFLGLVSP